MGKLNVTWLKMTKSPTQLSLLILKEIEKMNSWKKEGAEERILDCVAAGAEITGHMLNRIIFHHGFGPDRKDCPALTRAFIAQGVDLNYSAPEYHNQTTLHYAIDNKMIESALLLIKAGAKVNGMNALDETPLHLAANDDMTEVIAALIDAGADINARQSNGTGHTPLTLAAIQGEYLAVTKLIGRGADTGIKADLITGPWTAKEIIEGRLHEDTGDKAIQRFVTLAVFDIMTPEKIAEMAREKEESLRDAFSQGITEDIVVAVLPKIKRTPFNPRGGRP